MNPLKRIRGTKVAIGCVESEKFKKMTDYCESSIMAVMRHIADMSIGDLTAGHCYIQASTSSIPRTATARDGSSEKPAGESVIAGALR